MPAETHLHREPTTAEQLLELVLTMVDADDAQITASTTMRDVGIDSDLVICDLLAAIAEEFGERNLIADSTDVDRINPTMSLLAFAETITSALHPHSPL